MAAPLAVNKLVLQQTNSRKSFSVQIQSLSLLENLAAKKTSRTDTACEPDDILADQITQGIQQHLAHNGLSDAAWSLLTSESSITDVESVALALVMYLRGAGGLDSYGGITDGAVRLMLRITPQASTGKKSQGASTSTAPDTGASSKGEGALTAAMAWNKIKHLVPVRKHHRIVFKRGNAGPELIADEWSKLPQDATPVWGKSRFAGQPLVAPHADDAERWLTMEDALAHVSWHLQGAKDGTLDSVKASVNRSMQQLANRIANGHKHHQGVASAVQLAPSSKDLKTQEHAENAANYHAKYGALYDRRDETPAMLPKVAVDWLRTLREAAAQAAPLSQGGAWPAAAAAAAGTDDAAAPGEPADLAGAGLTAGAAAGGSSGQRAQEDEGVAVDAEFLLAPAGASPVPRRSPRLAQRQQQQQQGQQQPFAFSAAGLDGAAGAPAAAGGQDAPAAAAGAAAAGSRRSARQREQEQAQQQQRQQQQRGAGDAAAAGDNREPASQQQAAAEAFDEAVSLAQDYFDSGLPRQGVLEKLLQEFDATLAEAVVARVEPSERQLSTQGTQRAVVPRLPTAAQKQAARNGRDHEAAAAAAKGKAKGKRGRPPSKPKPATSRLQRRRVIQDADSDDADAGMLEDDMGSDEEGEDGVEEEDGVEGEDGVGAEGPAARAGKRQRRPPGWKSRDM